MIRWWQCRGGMLLCVCSDPPPPPYVCHGYPRCCASQGTVLVCERLARDGSSRRHGRRYTPCDNIPGGICILVTVALGEAG